MKTTNIEKTFATIPFLMFTCWALNSDHNTYASFAFAMALGIGFSILDND